MLFAVKRKSRKVVRFLLEMNVVSKNANHCNGSKVSALSIACGSGSMEMVKLLVEEGAQVDYSGNNNIDKFILGGISIGESDNPGDNVLTPLMCAARHDHAEIIKYLVEEAGANIETQDKKRRTALFSSLEGTPNAEALKMLLQLGANPYVKDWRGETALHVAAAHNRSKMAEILLEKEPSLNDALDDDDKMPIHHAISTKEWQRNRKGNMEVFRVLLKFNPDLDYRDHGHGMNLLHHAISDGVDVE